MAKAFVNPLDALLGYQLRRASAWVLADLGRGLADLDLRPADASIVLLIDANPSITQSEIGRILGIQRANMAPMVGALTERGLIGKTRATGRTQALRLTEVGVVHAQRIADRIAAHEARFLSDLKPADRAALAAVVKRIWAIPRPEPDAR